MRAAEQNRRLIACLMLGVLRRIGEAKLPVSGGEVLATVLSRHGEVRGFQPGEERQAARLRVRE